MPPARLLLQASKDDGGLLEMGVHGEESFASEQIPFNEFVEVADKLQPLFDRFLHRLHAEYGIEVQY
jgi:hypothetical protein